MADSARTPHPNALPNYKDAVIAREKLEGYALDPAHPRGKHKAGVFRSALGFDQSNWSLLAECIRHELPYHEAGLGSSDTWGMKYTVVLPITGPNGCTADVHTAWIIRIGSDVPSLITLYVV
jgi:hypothetical protein